ncbi:hypothetical protein [Caldicoprobacter faecalis]
MGIEVFPSLELVGHMEQYINATRVFKIQ